MQSLLLAGYNSTFGGKHLIWLGICAIFIAVSLFFLITKKPKMKTIEKIMLIIGIISETIKVITYICINEEEYGGYLPKTDLPFHLCSIQILFFVVLNLSNNAKIKRVLYSFLLPTCLFGGFFALLLPTSSARTLTLISAQYFLYHASILLFAVYLIITKEIKFELKDYFNSLIMLFVAFFVAIYLNSWINDYESNINFMYVIKPPMDGLPYLTKEYGWLVYIVHYAMLVILCVTLCYIKPIIEGFKKLKSKKNKC